MKTSLAILLLTVFSIGYSFGETDGSERWKRISKAESKLMCDHQRKQDQ